MTDGEETEPAVAHGSQPQPGSPATDSLGDPLPEGARLRLGTVRFRPPSNIHELALSPDGKTVVTVGDELIAWDAETGKERWRNGPGLRQNVGYGQRALAFSSDSSRFYTPGAQNEVFIWDTASGRREVVTIKKANDGDNGRQIAPLLSVDVTSDGKKLAVGSAAGVVICDTQGKVFFEIANRAPEQRRIDNNDRLGFGGPYSFGRFSPDGRLLAVVISDRPDEIRLHDAESCEELRTLKLASKLVRLDFSPDGKQIAATERDSAVRLYEVESGRRIWEHTLALKNPFENYTSAVAFSPDRKIIAAGATDKRIYLFDAETGNEVGQLVGHHWYPWALAFSTDSKMLYSSGWDGPVRRWDVASRSQLALPGGVHASEVVAASPDGRTLAWQDDAGRIHLVESHDGRERRRLELPDTRFSQLQFSPDGRQLAAGGSTAGDVRVALWEVASGALLQQWNWAKGRDPHSTVEALSFTSDGGRLAAAVFRQSAAYVWDLNDGVQIAELTHGEIYGLSFSPDGKTLATAGWDSTVRFWDTATWATRREFKVPDDGRRGDPRMYAVCYAPDGGLLATAHMDTSVRIWQPEAMLPRAKLQVGGSFVYGALNFSPDGLWLATGTSGGAVALWDPLTGRKVWDRGRHQFYVYTVGFGRDSRTLVSGSDDGTCYSWDLRPSRKDQSGDLQRLWDDLAGEDGAAAYQAMWTLSESPDRTVGLLKEKLRAVKSVVDLDRMSEGVSPEEHDRRRRLKKRLAEKDATVQLALPVRRCAALLAQLGTPEAKRLLEELAARDPDGNLGQIAAGALQRLSSDPR